MKFGFLLLFSDFFLIIVMSLPFLVKLKSKILNNNKRSCDAERISKYTIIWFGFNDFIVGIYCLFSFIIPLYKQSMTTYTQNIV